MSFLKLGVTQSDGKAAVCGRLQKNVKNSNEVAA